MSFGIPQNILPITFEGEIIYDNLNQFVANRKRIETERQSKMSAISHCPSSNDVLLGRGRPYQEYQGNLQLAQIIESRQDEYQGGNRVEKTQITKEIVKVVKAANGLFLQRDENGQGWEEVGDSVAREKVSYGFRAKSGKK